MCVQLRGVRTCLTENCFVRGWKRGVLGSVEAVVQVDCLSDVTLYLIAETVLTDITQVVHIYHMDMRP